MSTFTCFPKLPEELQDKIWEMALTEYRLLVIDRDHRDPQWHWPKYQNYGCNPGRIARTCRQALRRWDALRRRFMPVYISDNPPTSAAFHRDRTIFAPNDLRCLENFCNINDSRFFKPLHVVVPLPKCCFPSFTYADSTIEQLMDDPGRCEECGNEFHHGLLPLRQLSDVETLIKECMTWKFDEKRAQTLCDMVWGSDLDDSRRFEKDGTEWARVIERNGAAADGADGGDDETMET